MATERKILFFAEPITTEAAERIGSYLAERQIACNWREGVEDTEGKPHQGWDGLDLRTMRLIRSMQRQDTRVLVSYWEHEDSGGARLKSANFIVITAPGLKLRRSAKYKQVARQIPKRATT
jgi:hypothetical protein